MAAINFPFTEDRRPSKNVESLTRNIQFGDGYLQRINDSIHNFKKSYSVTFNNRSNADDIIDFFEARNGVEAFNFDGEEVICQKWSEVKVTPGIKSVSATFTVVYD